MIRPQDIMIGDWLLYNGLPHCVSSISEKWLTLKSPRKKNCCGPCFVSYEKVTFIPISPDYLTLFGFTKCEPGGWLFNEAWRFESDEVEIREARVICISWLEDVKDNSREYRTTCRGYGDLPNFPFDAISDIQHYFYNDSHCLLPIKPNM